MIHIILWFMLMMLIYWEVAKYCKGERRSFHSCL